MTADVAIAVDARESAQLRIVGVRGPGQKLDEREAHGHHDAWQDADRDDAKKRHDRQPELLRADAPQPEQVLHVEEPERRVDQHGRQHRDRQECERPREEEEDDDQQGRRDDAGQLAPAADRIVDGRP